MKKIVLITLIILGCKSHNINERKKESVVILDSINSIILNASHITNNEARLIYNSIDTISTTLIVNKKIVSKDKMRSVLDTIRMQNYTIEIDKKNRRIIMRNKYLLSNPDK